ncbi:uncharacterized protein [Kogia breviceps]|uniref:uncharacterized protein n=1 Tax=Kogia breviceps TaxID=27615 RepID=UPI0034D24F60
MPRILPGGFSSKVFRRMHKVPRASVHRAPSLPTHLHLNLSPALRTPGWHILSERKGRTFLPRLWQRQRNSGLSREEIGRQGLLFLAARSPAAQPGSPARSAGCDRGDPRRRGRARLGRRERVRNSPARERRARGRQRSAARAQSCAAPSRPPHLARAAAGARGSGQHNAPGPRPGRLEHITPGLSSKQLAVPSSPPPSAAGLSPPPLTDTPSFPPEKSRRRREPRGMKKSQTKTVLTAQPVVTKNSPWRCLSLKEQPLEENQRGKERWSEA